MYDELLFELKITILQQTNNDSFSPLKVKMKKNTKKIMYCSPIALMNVGNECERTREKIITTAKAINATLLRSFVQETKVCFVQYCMRTWAE